jgi:hypothetical protein
MNARAEAGAAARRRLDGIEEPLDVAVLALT